MQLLKEGFSFTALQSMNDIEVMEYYIILQELNAKENEDNKRNR